jgi:hypothetical protein
MIHKEKIGNELYVYMNGSLLYKRWLNQGHGIIIQDNSFGSFRAADVWQHVTEKDIEKQATTTP